MPADRDISTSPAGTPPYVASSARRRKVPSHSARVPPTEIIVISSDDESPSSPPRAASKGLSKNNGNGQRKTGVLTASRSVLQVTSDDECPARHAGNTTRVAGRSVKEKLAEVEKAMSRVQEENRVLKAKMEELNAHLSVRKSISPSVVANPAPPGSALISLDDLDDLVSCQVCTLKMWIPYLLPDCGHTFCQSCLVDWFDTTLTQFAASHPHYNPNTAHVPNPHRPEPTAPSYATMPAEVVSFLRNPQIIYNPVHALSMSAHQILARYRHDVERQRQGLAGQGGNTGNNGGDAEATKPEYTCPFCRLVLRSRPIEDFRLKEIVKKLSDAAGEKEEPSKGSAALKNPFVTYFP